MIILHHDMELAELLCKLFRATAAKRILDEHLEKRAWVISFSYAWYDRKTPTTAFCEIQGSPAKGQFCFNFEKNIPTPILAAGSLHRQSFRTKACPAHLLETYDRARALLQELAKQH